MDILEEKLDEFCAKLGLTKRCYCEINLALEELFTNIISYGFIDDKEHRIKFSIIHEDDTVTILIEDDGVPFNPMDIDEPDLKCEMEKRKVGGLGIHLIKNMMDRIDYKRQKNKNLLTLIKHL
ncbi:MAG: ATP-binding protein [Deltaproteobacteria bacterium]|nr:ATP-binding protein [Deltaproteobacteria bacterium]